jgi:hypothetical protein
VYSPAAAYVRSESVVPTANVAVLLAPVSVVSADPAPRATPVVLAMYNLEDATVGAVPKVTVESVTAAIPLIAPVGVTVRVERPFAPLYT